MRRWRESKAWPIFLRKAFMTFSSDSSKIRDFRKCVSVEDGKWTSTHNVCIYTAQVYPFVRKGVLCAIYTNLA